MSKNKRLGQNKNTNFLRGENLYFFDARKNWFPLRVRFPRARPEPVVSGVVLFPQESTLHYNQFYKSIFYYAIFTQCYIFPHMSQPLITFYRYASSCVRISPAEPCNTASKPFACASVSKLIYTSLPRAIIGS